MGKLTEPGKWYFVVDCSYCDRPIQGTPPQTPSQPQARNKVYRSGDTTERTAYRKAADRPAIKKGR